ncbi:unnamed protein product [Sphenostylis stenocarpa]|uniref:C2 domain-containing protein n=1 Tax=Sphenostylis stenocarpa TaxID=92480 RepID=A0AA86VMX1_9FABA|nr:unnamed protein product [Sphenostylis stenocarpa]
MARRKAESIAESEALSEEKSPRWCSGVIEAEPCTVSVSASESQRISEEFTAESRQICRGVEAELLPESQWVVLAPVSRAIFAELESSLLRSRDMAIGFMEVQLVKAKGLRNTDIFGKMDPYVLIQYKDQEKRSSVANGQGKNPVWNEKFIFIVEYPVGSNHQDKIIFKIMDKDSCKDDFVGQAIIHVGDLLAQGVENGGAKLQTVKYRVVRANKSYCGEIDVGVTFTPKVEDKFVEEEIGGWKESDYYLSRLINI